MSKCYIDDFTIFFAVSSTTSIIHRRISKTGAKEKKISFFFHHTDMLRRIFQKGLKINYMKYINIILFYILSS